MIVMYGLSRWCKEFQSYVDDVGFYIQQIGGDIHVGRHDIEFTFEEKYRDFVLMQYPFLKEIELVY